MKYFRSRRLMTAATFGANQPLSLIDAMSDFPITLNFPVSVYWLWSVLPDMMMSVPVRSLAGIGAGAVAAAADWGATLAVEDADAASEALRASISRAFFVSSTTVDSSVGTIGFAASACIGCVLPAASSCHSSF